MYDLTVILWIRISFCAEQKQNGRLVDTHGFLHFCKGRICEDDLRGALPEIPEKLLASPGYQVEFVSKIALSIKKIESMGWLQTEAAIASMAQTNPEILDNFDADLTANGAISL